MVALGDHVHPILLGILLSTCLISCHDQPSEAAGDSPPDASAPVGRNQSAEQTLSRQLELESDYLARCKLIGEEARTADDGNIAKCLSRLVAEGVLSQEEAMSVAVHYFRREVLPIDQRWEIFETALDGAQRLSLANYLFEDSFKTPKGVEEALEYFDKLPQGIMSQSVAGAFSNSIMEHLGEDRLLDWCVNLDTAEMHRVLGPLSMNNEITPGALLVLAERPNTEPNISMVLGAAARRFVEEDMCDEALEWGIESHCSSSRYWNTLLKSVELGDGLEIYSRFTIYGDDELLSGNASKIASRIAVESDLDQAQWFADQIPQKMQKHAYFGIGRGMASTDTHTDELIAYGSSIGDLDSRKGFLKGLVFGRVAWTDVAETLRVLEASGDSAWVESQLEGRSK